MGYKLEAKTRKSELIESKRDIHKFTNWGLSIKLGREPEKIKSGHQTKKGLSMRNLFDKSFKRNSSKTVDTIDENVEETENMEVELLSRSAPKPRLISITDLEEARNSVPRRASAA